MPDIFPGHEFRFYYFANRYHETVAFYKNILQLEEFRSWDRADGDKGTIFKSPNGTGLIEIEARAENPVFNGMGLYIQVDNPDGLYESLLKSGVKIVQPITTTSYGHRSFKCEDPNKLLISFFSYIDPVV
jgi:uncharacterized glyoxalase superfamily protein PhnB